MDAGALVGMARYRRSTATRVRSAPVPGQKHDRRDLVHAPYRRGTAHVLPVGRSPQPNPPAGASAARSPHHRPFQLNELVGTIVCFVMEATVRLAYPTRGDSSPSQSKPINFAHILSWLGRPCRSARSLSQPEDRRVAALSLPTYRPIQLRQNHFGHAAGFSHYHHRNLWSHRRWQCAPMSGSLVVSNLVRHLSNAPA